MKPDSKPDRRLLQRSTGSETFVLMAMTLVAAAVGTGLYLQFGAGLLSAGMAGLAIYLGLVCVHALVRRSQAIRELSYEVDRLESEVMRIARGGGGPMPPQKPDQQPHFRPGPPPQAGMGPANRPPPLPRPGPGAPAMGGDLAAHVPRSPHSGAPGSPPLPIPAAWRSVPDGSAPQAVPPAGNETAASEQAVGPQEAAKGAAAGAPDRRPAAGAPGPQPGSPMARFWSVRPTDELAEAPRPGGAKPGTPPPIEAGATVQAPIPEQSTGARPPRGRSGAEGMRPAENRDGGQGGKRIEEDVDVINDMIRRFSEEIGMPESRPQPVAGPAPGGKTEVETISQGEAVISASVGALRAAADEMRRPHEAGSTPIERGILPPLRTDPRSTAPQPPPVGPSHALVAQLADAIMNQRLDVYLEPILGLADRKARHYDVSLRLRSGAESFGPEQCLPLARTAGLLPLLDVTRASRASMVARYLDERGSTGCLFATLTPESLASERFLGQFADLCRQAPRLRERLVLSIAQSEMRGLSATQWSTVRQLAGSGLRFAIDDVTSVDLDLPELKAAGFAFMRIATRTLIDGVSGLDGSIPAAEICRRVAGSGVTVIAIGLESEEQLDGVLGGGVPLGQGPLFGHPRPVKAEALRPQSSAAA